MKRTVLLLVAIAILLLCTACNPSEPIIDDNPPEASTPNAEAAPEKTAVPDPTPAITPELSDSKVIALGDTISVKGLNITVNSARIEHGFDFIKPEVGSVYYVLDITFENTTDEDDSISSLLQMSLLDDEGYSHSVTLDPDTKGSLDGTVTAGRKLRGEIGFEVPENVQTLEFVFDPLYSKAVYFDVPNIWETIAIEKGMPTSALLPLRDALTIARLEVLNTSQVITNSDGSFDVFLTTSIGSIDVLMNASEVALIGGVEYDESGELPIYYMSDVAKEKFEEAGMLNPETGNLIPQV